MPMPLPASYTPVSSEAELTELLGEPSIAVVEKDRARLHALDKRWLAASPFCLIGTANERGQCDVSPKGDPMGFVHVVDDTTVAIPERPGNRRADGFRNILQNPHVGLLSIIPGRDQTLRINGHATLLRDAPFFDDLVVKGHRPVLVILLSIEQIFFHCGKAFMRSHLWLPEAWKPDALPPHAQIVKEVEARPEPLADLEHYYGPSYAERLYKS
jgi:uncharacterized protein